MGPEGGVVQYTKKDGGRVLDVGTGLPVFPLTLLEVTPVFSVDVAKKMGAKAIRPLIR
jgi:hypothetical protein